MHEKAPLVRSLMLGGPRGTGKNMLVHAICTETGANLFDLTATNIAGKYPGKDGLKMLMHLVFKVGRALQPAVLLVDNCERMFKKKVPKGDTVRFPSLSFPSASASTMSVFYCSTLLLAILVHLNRYRYLHSLA